MCIDCELCTEACPSFFNVHRAERVWSDECMSCYACVEACPVKKTIVMSAGRNSKSIPSWIFGFLIIGIFITVTGLAMLTGRWQNSISKDEYLKRIQNIESSLYQHTRGQVPNYGPND
jgi:ferredoxin